MVALRAKWIVHELLEKGKRILNKMTALCGSIAA